MSTPSPVEAIFFAALEKDESQRAAYLDEACAGDPDLRRRVERLLAAHPRVGSFLEQPAVAQAADRTESGDAAEGGGQAAAFLEPSRKPGSRLPG